MPSAYTQNSLQPSQQVMISSRQASFPSGTTAEFEVVLHEAIRSWTQDTRILVSVPSACIPNSAYSCSAGNDTIDILYGNGASESKVLPHGNYTALSLATALGDALNWADATENGVAYTKGVHYNRVTNKLSFRNATAGFQFLFGSGANKNRNPSEMLGFTTNRDTAASTNSVLTSDSVLDVTGGRQEIHIRSNLVSHSTVEGSAGETSDVLACIPVTVKPFDIIHYQASNPFKMLIPGREVRTIKMRLTSGHRISGSDRTVDLNGKHWMCVVQFDFVHGLSHGVPDPEHPRIRMQRAMNHQADIDHENLMHHWLEAEDERRAKRTRGSSSRKK